MAEKGWYLIRYDNTTIGLRNRGWNGPFESFDKVVEFFKSRLPFYNEKYFIRENCTYKNCIHKPNHKDIYEIKYFVDVVISKN